MQYLGLNREKKKMLRPSEKFKNIFNFEWDDNQGNFYWKFNYDYRYIIWHESFIQQQNWIESIIRERNGGWHRLSRIEEEIVWLSKINKKIWQPLRVKTRVSRFWLRKKYK